MSDDPKYPTEKEFKALRLFAGKDPTRLSISTVWEYSSVSPWGCSHVATNGHVIALRRAGSHVEMSLYDIAKLAPLGLDLDSADPAVPPNWPHVLQTPNCEGKNLAQRAIDPAYFALVAAVAKAATEKRPRDGYHSVWSIGCDPLNGWHWMIPEKHCRPGVIWEGVIMPRRVYL